MIGLITNLFSVAEPGCEKSFLGLRPWFHYLETNPEPDCGIKEFTVLGPSSDIPLVLLAVVDDLLRIAGLVAVVFVIYGGVMYITSQGNPDQASKAQSTILNALAGLAIALVAIFVVSFLGNKFS